MASLILKGWAYRYLMLPDGRRQIAGFLLPGDLCNFDLPGLLRLDYSVATLTECEVLQLAAPAIKRLAGGSARVEEAMAIHAHVSGAITRSWLLSLGQRSALERIGHLFCELHVRLRCVGLVDGEGFEFPVTQIELAEATGLTAVHVNRTLQDMRARKLVILQNRHLRILDFERLANLVMFDGAYLHPTLTGCKGHG